MPSGINSNLPRVAVGDIIRAVNLDEVHSAVNRFSQMPRGGNAHVLVNAAGVFVNPLEREPYFDVYNQSNSDCPAYGVGYLISGQAEGTAALPLPGFRQPIDYGGLANFVFASPQGIKANSTGQCQAPGWGPLIAAYDPADGTPQSGINWGPRPNTWLLKQDTPGFLVLKVWDTTNHYVLVWPMPMTKFWGQNKTGSTINKGSAATLHIMAGDSGALVDTGLTMQNCVAVIGNVPNNAICLCLLNDNNNYNGSSPVWQIAQMDVCPP